MWIVSALLAAPAALLARRHDVEEARYLELGESFPAVVQVGGLASGTLIAREWVLTVAHAPEMLKRRPDAPLKVKIGDEEIEVAEVHVPDLRALEPERHDIALLRLAHPAPVDLVPLPLSDEDVEPGTEFVLAGWGILARGDQGVELTPETMAAPTRARRAGRNLVERIDLEKALLVARFDGPEKGLELEAGACIGDSGGPALVRLPGADGQPTWHIVGVLAAIDDTDEDRVVGEYGEEFAMTMVAFYAEWIRETTGS
jgi:hypothetical protein